MLGARTMGHLDRLDRLLGVVIKLAAIAGGLVAVWLFLTGRSAELTGQSVERKRVVLEEVFRTKSHEVTQALVRLERIYERSGDLTTLEAELDIAYVMTWYEHLGMLWIHDHFLDKCVIRAAVEPYAALVANVLDAVKYPIERRTYFNILRNRMTDHRC